MAANVYQPHLLLLLEDDKNRQFFNGFAKHPRLLPRRIDPQKVAGGWSRVLEMFEGEHLALLRRYTERHLLMVIDFDDEYAAAASAPSTKLEHRRNLFLEAVPDDLKERVFVIGCSENPERLTTDRRESAESIGERLAQDCVDGTDELWGHPMLQHNSREILRLREKVRPFLFR